MAGRFQPRRLPGIAGRHRVAADHRRISSRGRPHDERPEDHRSRGDLPPPAPGQGAVRQRPGRADRPGDDRRRDRRLRRGRLEPDGGQGGHRGAVLAHDGDGAGPRRRRRGPVPDRVPLAQDVPGEHLRRPARRRPARDERDRHGPLGHQGQGAGPARLEAARGRLRHLAPALRQQPLRRHARGDRRAGPALRRPGLHRRQVRLGPDGPVRGARHRPGPRGPRRASATRPT